MKNISNELGILSSVGLSFALTLFGIRKGLELMNKQIYNEKNRRLKLRINKFLKFNLFKNCD